jgi:hypothetical protein
MRLTRTRPSEHLVIWHVVRLDLGDLDEPTRLEIEAALAGLAHLDVVSFLRSGRDVEDPSVTGLVVGLADEAALAAYRDHPDHLPVVRRIRELGVPVSRLDIASDDDATVLA